MHGIPLDDCALAHFRLVVDNVDHLEPPFPVTLKAIRAPCGGLTRRSRAVLEALPHFIAPCLFRCGHEVAERVGLQNCYCDGGSLFSGAVGASFKVQTTQTKGLRRETRSGTRALDQHWMKEERGVPVFITLDAPSVYSDSHTRRTLLKRFLDYGPHPCSCINNFSCLGLLFTRVVEY